MRLKEKVKEFYEDHEEEILNFAMYATSCAGCAACTVFGYYVGDKVGKHQIADGMHKMELAGVLKIVLTDPDNDTLINSEEELKAVLIRKGMI